MHRTEGSNNIGGLFTDGPPPSTLNAAWCNSIQEELANVIETYGDPLQSAATDTRNQLLAAILNIVQQYDYIVTTQAGFQSIIERTGANTYQFKSGYRSVLFKYGDYNISGILSAGDTWGDIKTNECSNLIFESGATLHFGDIKGCLEVNTNNCYLQNVCIRGTGTVATNSQKSFYLNAYYVTFENCSSYSRLSNTTFRTFTGSLTDFHNKTSKYNNCLVRNIESSSETSAFYLCENLNNCIVTDVISTANNMYTFKNCYRLSNCIVYDVTSIRDIYGFCNCEEMSNCKVNGFHVTVASGVCYGFFSCNQLSSCVANDLDNITNALCGGFFGCEQLSNCKVEDIDSQSSCFGYYQSKRLSACKVYDILTTNINSLSYGYYQCDDVSACIADTIQTSGAGGVCAAYGFYDCDQVVGCKSSGIVSLGGGATAYGFYDCMQISSCHASLTNANVALGFTSCLVISSCYANGIISTASNATGFYNCHYMAACYAGTITGFGTEKGFDGCSYGASLYTAEASNPSNDWIDSTDAQITNKWSCPSVWT